jgi:hypothetical protein
MPQLLQVSPTSAAELEQLPASLLELKFGELINGFDVSLHLKHLTGDACIQLNCVY